MASGETFRLPSATPGRNGFSTLSRTVSGMEMAGLWLMPLISIWGSLKTAAKAPAKSLAVRPPSLCVQNVSMTRL